MSLLDLARNLWRRKAEPRPLDDDDRAALDAALERMKCESRDLRRDLSLIERIQATREAGRKALESR